MLNRLMQTLNLLNIFICLNSKIESMLIIDYYELCYLLIDLMYNKISQERTTLHIHKSIQTE